MAQVVSQDFGDQVSQGLRAWRGASAAVRAVLPGEQAAQASLLSLTAILPPS